MRHRNDLMILSSLFVGRNVLLRYDRFGVEKRKLVQQLGRDSKQLDVVILQAMVL